MRLLTEEEINKLLGYPADFRNSYLAGGRRIANAQRDLTHKETLKAVGE